MGLVPCVAIEASVVVKEANDCVVAQSPGCGQGIGVTTVWWYGAYDVLL